MNLIYGQTSTIVDFVRRHAFGAAPGVERGFGPATAIGVSDGEKLVAGVIYHDWTPETGTIEISTAAVNRKWLSRPVLRAIFDYPFNQIGCQMVIARTLAENYHLRRMARVVGARECLIERLYGMDRDGVILTLTKEAWTGSKFAL